MKGSYLILATFILIIANTSLRAQETAVGNNINACVGFLVDSGLSQNNYGPNENLTSTICHDGSDEPLVSLYFAFFSLGSGDFLTIYDGSDNTAPLIGSYGNGSLQGLDITSTNPQGCLTVVFTSNGDDSVGSFGAQISCSTPCIRPVPIITNADNNQNPWRVCPNEQLTFNGGTSTFAPGATLASFLWDFGDGTTNNSSWPTVTHTYATPGAYTVQLYLTDNNGCTSGILPDQLVFVATTPQISFTANDNQVCVGQEVAITATATGTNWTSLPTANFGGALFIPDNQSTCFSDTLTFGGFDPNAIIASVSDLEYFFINFEHSFMGDLVISFICPNGQSIAVHQQGGGGTYLGVPIDVDSNLNPGTGFDYFWTPTATNGTWSENSGGTLASGRYESVQPFSNLIGCPLNGEWIIEVCDLWASDNGYIFDWSVQFADYLYPDLLSFTPTFGLGCDSTFISGPFITTQASNCNSATIIPTAAGNHTYTFTAIDDHGCTYTNQITVNAYPGPIPTAGADLYYCNTPTQLTGSVTNPVQGINYVYTWSPSAPLNNANMTSPTIQNLSQTTEFTLSVYPTQDPQCIVSDQVLVTIPATPLSAPEDTTLMCLGEWASLVAPQNVQGYSYIWSYSPNGDTYTAFGNTQDFEVAGSDAGFYEVEIVEPNCLFSATTSYVVLVEVCEIKIPNVFTPNGDGKNDTFEVFGLEKFPDSTLLIYNRWGNSVYESNNYRNNWNGSDNPEGTYYFILGVKRNSGIEYHEGHLTLLRR